MKSTQVSIICAAVLFSTSVFAEAVLTEASKIKFNPVPGFDGVYTAVVEGDPAKGAHHAFMKFDDGFAAPVHHHTANHYVAVLEGTIILTVDGVEHKLPAGSYFSFTKKGAHATKCDKGDDCVLFMDVRGKWDVKLPKEKK